MMAAVLLILSLASAVSAAASSDPMHIPLACSHWHSSHAIAGSLVGLGVDAYLKEVSPLGRVNRALIGVGSALLFGYFKEHGLDYHARNEQVLPWGQGALVACLAYEVKW